ncbi:MULTISPECIES: hypothetical protein [Pseudoalteromonas]|uniref:capsular polysaccharide export protein, LipB/KpsS family n=1 Tax=Pseudoalteromonas TaxID=53246 RepID=UPI0015816863|nr:MULTISPECIES: hypothetical protein [Pseudoalteromonas]MDI4652868.1 hypothetical protein [Pseudoalteromonas shioyasakiensis]NUJ39656.1 hypothetical protein [Pseudoalteromonas sp. 0303]
MSIILENQVCVFLNAKFVGYSHHEHTIAKYINFTQFENVFYLKQEKVLSTEWQEQQPRRTQFYHSVLVNNQFDEVLIWNGNFEYQQTFLSCLQTYPNIQKQFAEVGWFDQSNSIYIDPYGVNGKSLLAKTCPPALNHSELEKVSGFITEYTKDYLRVNCASNTLKILVPLQVDTDSNILNHSPFSSMQAFIDFLADWLPDKNVEIIVRPHPKATYNYALKSNRKDFIFDASGDIKSKIAESDIVIGINSTALIQALAFRKPVMAFGESVYSSSDAVHKVAVDPPFCVPQYNEKASLELIAELKFNQQIATRKAVANTLYKYIKQRINLLRVKRYITEQT